MKSVIKYPGSKWSIANWVIGHFPEHHSYLEPFFGSGAVLFNKRRSPIETVNDLDGDVVNLFRQIREDPERLADAIYWTPYAMAEYERAWAAQYTETDPFQRAVDFYIRMMMGHGFRTTGEKVGWKNDVQGREAAYAAGYWCKTPETIRQAAERLRKVQIECRPAVELIRRFNFPNVLIYADPPYVLGTRHGKQYRHEMTDRQHEELLEALLAHRGPVLLSGYDSDLYRDMLRGWHREEIAARAQTAGARTEVLWSNFEPTIQESLWTGYGVTTCMCQFCEKQCNNGLQCAECGWAGHAVHNTYLCTGYKGVDTLERMLLSMSGKENVSESDTSEKGMDRGAKYCRDCHNACKWQWRGTDVSESDTSGKKGMSEDGK